MLVLVLESFIGSDEENKKYASPLTGVIPWALHHPVTGKKKRQNIIDINEQRAKELSEKGVVRPLTKGEIARVKDDPTGLSLDPHHLAAKEREDAELRDLRKENADLQRQLAEAAKGKPLAGAIDKPAPATIDK